MSSAKPLIYLDHSTIVTLERTLKRDRSRFDDFVRRWNDNHCVLALSLFHQLEISGSKHADSRRYRIQVLEHLAPARADQIINPNAPPSLRTLAGREAFAMLGRIAGRGDLFERVDRHWVAFPTELPQGMLGLALRAGTSSKLRKVFGHFREAVKLEAAAITASGKTRAVHRRLRDLSSGPLSGEQAETVRTESRAFFESGEWENDIAASFPPEQRNSAILAVRAWMEAISERMILLGPREAFADHVGADLATSLKRFTHDLLVQHLFRHTVEQTAKEVVPAIDTAVLEQFQQMARLEDCPGTWLMYRVDRELRVARETWEPGATYDLLHLAHLPYVDLMITDSEIAENTRKVLRRPGLPPSLEEVRAPVAVAGSVEAVEQAIEEYLSSTN
jgi:hypothetical protein